MTRNCQWLKPGLALKESNFNLSLGAVDINPGNAHLLTNLKGRRQMLKGSVTILLCPFQPPCNLGWPVFPPFPELYV